MEKSAYPTVAYVLNYIEIIDSVTDFKSHLEANF